MVERASRAGWTFPRPAAEGARGREHKLKKLLAEAMLDNAMLRYVVARK